MHMRISALFIQVCVARFEKVSNTPILYYVALILPTLKVIFIGHCDVFKTKYFLLF